MLVMPSQWTWNSADLPQNPIWVTTVSWDDDTWKRTWMYCPFLCGGDMMSDYWHAREFLDKPSIRWYPLAPHNRHQPRSICASMFITVKGMPISLGGALFSSQCTGLVLQTCSPWASQWSACDWDTSQWTCAHDTAHLLPEMCYQTAVSHVLPATRISCTLSIICSTALVNWVVFLRTQMGSL